MTTLVCSFLFITLFLTLATAATIPVHPILSNYNFFNTSLNCSEPAYGDNQALACYMKRGCVACEVAADQYQCLPAVTCNATGPVFANATCAAINTTYGSHLVRPVDVVWEGLDVNGADWIRKLTNRRDMRILENAANLTWIQTDLTIYLTALHVLYDQFDTSNPAVLGSFLAGVANATKARNADIEARWEATEVAWQADEAENKNWTARVFKELAILQQRREAAENASLISALLTAEAVSLHHALAYEHYCFAVTRFQHRLVVLRDIALIIEDVHVLLLLNSLTDIVLFYRDRAVCLQNATLCTWNATLGNEILECFIARRAVAWQLIGDLVEFLAYVDIFQAKVDVLWQLKCVDELDILVDLDNLIVQLNKNIKADITYIRSHANNATKFYHIVDMYMDFAYEVEDIFASITNSNDPLASFIQILFTVKSDLILASDTLAIVAARFCKSLKPILIAHLGADITTALCDPTTVTQIQPTRKRQDELESYPPAISLSQSTQTSSSVTTPGSPTGPPTGSPTGTPTQNVAGIVKVALGAVVAGVSALLL